MINNSVNLVLFFNIIKLRAGLSLFHLIILSFILGPPVEVIVDATILSITSLDAINMVPLTFSPLFILSIKKCSKFTGDHPCRSVISIKLICNLIEIALRHGCSPVNLLYIFRKTFCKNIYGGLFLPLAQGRKISKI